MYSIGNEVSETATKKGAEVCRQLADFVHGLDDTRPVTAGINVLLNVYANMGLGVYKDKGDYKAEPLSDKKGDKKGDKACLGAAQGLNILGLNYAASRYDPDAEKYPERMMVFVSSI